jgi:hypothetical protein
MHFDPNAVVVKESRETSNAFDVLFRGIFEPADGLAVLPSLEPAGTRQVVVEPVLRSHEPIFLKLV